MRLLCICVNTRLYLLKQDCICVNTRLYLCEYKSRLQMSVCKSAFSKVQVKFCQRYFFLSIFISQAVKVHI